jgi:hypothetical protein
MLAACGSPTPRTETERAKPEPAKPSETTGSNDEPTKPVAASEPTSTPPSEHQPHTPPAERVPITPERCSIRVTARGITVDGDAMERKHAVALCKQRVAALVELGDGANESEWQELRTALVAAGVTIMMRGTRDDKICLDNPLAKGCD